jgi:hypothetical protein
MTLMRMIEAPYSIAPEGHEEGEFDLYNLGPTKSVFVGGIIGSENFDAGGMFSTHQVDRKDYDELFAKKLLKIDPPHRVHAYLEHHLRHSIDKLGGASVFLDHFKYTILHPLEQHRAYSPHVAAASDWYNKTMDNIHKQHRRERNYFLSEAFRVAHEHSPSSPLQVSLDPVEFGKSIGFDEAATTRIMHDLVDEGLVTSSLGMGMLMVTGKGRRYLEQLHGDDDPRLNPPTIVNNTYNASGGSILQVATHSPHATQTANVGDQLAETRAFTERVTAKLDEIQQLITAEQFVSLKADLEFLKEKLDEPKPRLSLIAQLQQGIMESLPSELVAFVVGKLAGG